MPCLDHKMELAHNIKYTRNEEKASSIENIDIGCVIITLVIPNVFFTVQSKKKINRGRKKNSGT